MPIQITQKKAENLAPQFDDALELVRNEFEGSTRIASTAMPLPGYSSRTRLGAC